MIGSLKTKNALDGHKFVLTSSFYRTNLSLFWRPRSDLNRRIKVLQTRALPLGYGAKALLYYTF